MTTTPFPARPCEVVALTVQEFTCGLDLSAEPSISLVCERFLDDANRALVWLIRFGALRAWCARAETNAWLMTGAARARACEMAASFALNGDWEFDAERFHLGVEAGHAPLQES
jgi:hypothetical protein